MTAVSRDGPDLNILGNEVGCACDRGECCVPAASASVVRVRATRKVGVAKSSLRTEHAGGSVVATNTNAMTASKHGATTWMMVQRIHMLLASQWKPRRWITMRIHDREQESL